MQQPVLPDGLQQLLHSNTDINLSPTTPSNIQHRAKKDLKGWCDLYHRDLTEINQVVAI